MEDFNLDMSILYAQSLEIQLLYNESIDKNSINILKYYLFPKCWVDKYKKENNYESNKKIIKNKSINFIQLSSVFLNPNISTTNNNLFLRNAFKNNIPILKKETNTISKKYISYPIDFFLIKEDILKSNTDFSSFNKSDCLYELIIGENNIFIFDNTSKKNIFICSIYCDNEDIDEFIINIDYILIFKEENTFLDEMKNYICGKGINNYFLKREITIKEKVEQKIKKDENDEIGIGIIYTLRNINTQTPGEFNIKYAQNIDLKEIENLNDVSEDLSIDFNRIISIKRDEFNNNNEFINKNIILNNNQNDNQNNIYQNNNNNYNNKYNNNVYKFQNPNCNPYNIPNNNINRNNIIITLSRDIYYQINNDISISFMNSNTRNNYKNQFFNNNLGNKYNNQNFNNNLGNNNNYNNNNYLNNNDNNIFNNGFQNNLKFGENFGNKIQNNYNYYQENNNRMNIKANNNQNIIQNNNYNNGNNNIFRNINNYHNYKNNQNNYIKNNYNNK